LGSFSNDRKYDDVESQNIVSTAKFNPPKLNLNKILLSKKSQRNSIDKYSRLDVHPISNICLKKMRLDGKKKTAKARPESARKKGSVRGKHLVKAEYSNTAMSARVLHPQIFVSYKDLTQENSPKKSKIEKQKLSPKLSKDSTSKRFLMSKKTDKKQLNGLLNHNTMSRIKIENINMSRYPSLYLQRTSVFDFETCL
jgi:hypothetical protein